MNRPIMCINVAIGKPAEQSSVSIWSTESDAGGAVSGAMPTNFGFHTDKEDSPWWMVDLQYNYPIDKLVIHNRIDMCFERARSCKVEISNDGVSWTLVHAGLSYFRGGNVGSPLTLPLGCRVTGRYLRISLEEKEYLHLAQVEVIGHVGARVKGQYNLAGLDFQGDFSNERSLNRNWLKLAYFFEGKAPVDLDIALVGVAPVSFGRLGNQLIQIANATLFVRRLGIKYVVVRDEGLIRLPKNFEYAGVKYIPTAEYTSDLGLFLAGNFFFAAELSPVLDGVMGLDLYHIVQDVIRPYLLDNFLAEDDARYEDELTVHFRSGDIFKDPLDFVGYTQPPLSFYTLIVRHLMREGLVRRVRLVFEDKGNPCIESFIAFLDQMNIAYRLQSGSLKADLSAMVDASHLVFGYGTFGVAVCLLSQKIGTLCLFESLSDPHYEGMPSVGRTIIVRDRESGYMKAADWRNALHQRQLMLEYPESALEIVH